ncbi:MAG: ABC transporter permease [Clostridiales bacterium]|nr:ABC transporter permease [Clostridiales bacterium]
MNLFSILRLSFHNLWQNKLRTLLTIIVLMVVSFVVVLLAGVGYSFYRSLNANVSYLFGSETSYISVGYDVSGGEHSVYEGVFTPEQVQSILDILDNDDGYITGIGFMQEDPYQGGFRPYSNVYASDENTQFGLFPYYGKSNPFVGAKGYEDGGYLAAGRMWNASDTGSDNCWLDKSVMNRYAVGDSITLTRRSYGENPAVVWQGTFTVAGFLDMHSSDNYMNACVIDYKQFNDEKAQVVDWNSNSDKMVIKRIYAKMVPQDGFSYGIKTQNYIKSLVKKIDKAVVPTESTGKMATHCDILDHMTLATILSLVLIALIVLISLIIILLSIGCVANTIKISAEQNRRFFGVMKAIGMKNKSLRHILIGQIIIMTVLAVAIASLAAYFMMGTVRSLLSSGMALFFSAIEEPIVICSLNPVIPVGIALLLIGFVLLFTRTSLREFSKMDVISVINEVN